MYDTLALKTPKDVLFNSNLPNTITAYNYASIRHSSYVSYIFRVVIITIFGPAIAGFLGQPRPGIKFGGGFGGVDGEERRSLLKTKSNVKAIIAILE